MKAIRFTKHAREQVAERGATTAEIEEAIRKGSRERAKDGRELCRYNFTFGATWQGKPYAVKKLLRSSWKKPAQLWSLPCTLSIFEESCDEDQL